MFHSGDPMSGYNDTNEYCTGCLAKPVIERDNMLLSMACECFHKEINCKL